MSNAAPWLFVVDMQVCFAEPSSPWAVPEYATAESAVQRLLDDFGPRTVLTRFVSPAAPKGAWIDYYRAWPTMHLSSTDAAWKLTVAVPDGAVEVTRHTFSKWDERVGRLLPRRAPVVMCGVSTETCVLATALRAIDDGRKVFVVADACRGADVGLHDNAVNVLRSFQPQAQVVTTADVLAWP